MRIIERSVHRPVAVTVGVLLVMVFGSLGLLGVFDFLRLPVQLTPNVDQPVITVTTNWFGASPQEIEQEVIDEQERVLKTVSGLREMLARCSEGMGTIELRFYVGVNKEAALNEVRDKLRQVREYPPDVDQPVVESVDAGTDSFIAWMLLRPVGDNPASTQAHSPRESGVPGYDGDVTQLQDFLEDEVKPILERVEGIASVNVLGGRQREMQVRVDLDKLAGRGIGIDQLTGALRAENLNVTAGTIDRGKHQTSIRAAGQYEDPQRIRDTVVAYSATGAPIYVKDVAEVELGFKKATFIARSRGRNMVALNAKRESGSNIISVMAGLKRAIAQVNSDVLKARKLGLELHQVYDEAQYVQRSLDNAEHDVLLGAVLAAVVLLLSLRSIGATAVVMLSIPISVAGTFLGLALAGRNLNVISLAGLAFSVGFGIDNAIVVLENIFRHREMGKGRVRAAIDGGTEVWGAIVASTVTNVAVFLPMLFIQEEAGQLFRDISVAITISMGFYLFVSPTVVPMLASLLLRHLPGGFRSQTGDESPTLLARLTRPLTLLGTGFSRMFYKLVFWLTGGWIRRSVLVLVLIGASSYGSWMMIPPRTYLPPGNQNFVFSILSPPPGYSLDEYRSIAELVESRLRPWWEAKEGSRELAALQKQFRAQLDQFVIPGMEQQLKGQEAQLEKAQADLKSAPDAQLAALEQTVQQLQGQVEQTRQQVMMMKYLPPPSSIDNYFFVAYQGRLFMGASSGNEDNVAPLAMLMNTSIQGIPGTFGFAAQVPIFRLGRVTGSAIEVNVSGTNYDKVRAAAGILQGAMIQRFRAFATADPVNFALGRPELRVVANPVRAAAAGVSPQVVRQMVQVGVDGMILGDYRLNGQTIDLTVVAARAGRSTPEALRDVPVATGDGRVVPLSSVADFVNTSAAQEIVRLERQPSVSLGVQLPSGMTVQEGSRIVEEEVVAPLRAGGMIPPDVSTRLAGSADKLNEFMKAFVPGFALAAIVTYLLMAALFESFLHPLVIIMSVPFALVGGFLGLLVLNLTTGEALLDVLTMLGFVILIGVIINNPILIVHQALNYLREGMDRRRAIALSTQTRVRPIFMSVVTSVAGMAPLVVVGGAGSELYRGLGAVVVGGLLLSTIFTLFLTPTLMSLMLDLQGVLKRLLGLGQKVQHSLPPPFTAPLEPDQAPGRDPVQVL